MADNDVEGQQNPPRVRSGYVDRVAIETLNKLGTDELKANFAKAMFMAVKLHPSGNSKVHPCDHKQIYTQCRFNLGVQREYGISLNKEQAIEFLSSFTGRTISSTSFKKKYSKTSYVSKFNREAPILNRRNLICTYAEWLHLEDFLFEPELPQELISLIPEDWRHNMSYTESITGTYLT